MGLFDWLFGKNQAPPSGNVAKNRLQMVLVQDRINLPSDQVQKMKQEILEVISRYVKVDMENVDFEVANRDRSGLLIAEIPFLKEEDPTSDEITEQKSDTVSEQVIALDPAELDLDDAMAVVTSKSEIGNGSFETIKDKLKASLTKTADMNMDEAVAESEDQGNADFADDNDEATPVDSANVDTISNKDVDDVVTTDDAGMDEDDSINESPDRGKPYELDSSDTIPLTIVLDPEEDLETVKIEAASLDDDTDLLEASDDDKADATTSELSLHETQDDKREDE